MFLSYVFFFFYIIFAYVAKAGCTRHIQKNLFLIAFAPSWHVLKTQLNFDDMKSLHLSPSGALKKGWELTKKHFIVMLGLVLGYMVLLWVISLLSGADTTTFRYWILYLVNLVLSVWVSAGFAKILLNAYDGEEPSFSVFGELLPKLGGLIGVNVIVAVCYCIPLVLGFIVLFIGAGASAVSFNLADPYSFGYFMGQAFGGVTGILFLVLLLVSFYIALRLMFAVYAYVEDFSIGVMGAVRKSWTMTQGNMWTILLCILMIIVLNLLGLVALIIGVFVTMIITMFMTVAMYRQIKEGEEIVIVEE